MAHFIASPLFVCCLMENEFFCQVTVYLIYIFKLVQQFFQFCLVFWSAIREWRDIMSNCFLNSELTNIIAVYFQELLN